MIAGYTCAETVRGEERNADEWSFAGRFLLAAGATALALAALATPWIALRAPTVAMAARAFFAPLCRQNPARSFSLDGSPMAVCIRCMGVYTGLASGAWITLGASQRLSRARIIFVTVLVLNLCDVGAELLHLHGNLPILRFFLGLTLGFASALLLGAREGPAALTPQE
jgi:uncharacterized membrane protein